MKIKSALTLLTYRGLTTLVAPLGAMFIAYKKRRDAPYGKRIFELLGFYKETASNCIWFHGASVGEINALKPLVTEYVTTHLGCEVVVTTMTTTGAQAAESLKKLGVKVVFSPLDSPLAVNGFLNSFNPKLLVIIDTELWPNMLSLTHKRGCKIAIVNARMQEKNCQSYLKHQTIVKDLIASNLDKVMCISHSDLDLKPRENLFNEARAIKTNLLGDKVLGAISIHDGEEKTVIDAYLKAKEQVKDLKLVFVPRHMTTAQLARDYLESLKISYVRKSTLKDLNTFKGDILIGDTLGEIETYFGLCDLVFMGGSFVDIGGHNPLEPGFFSLPIITGPDYHNFKEQFDKLIETGGAYQADDEELFARYIVKLITDKELLKKTGIKALDLQQQGRGAVQRAIAQMDLLLK